RRIGLTPEPESLDQLLVARRIVPAQILEQPTSLTHDAEQTASRVVILRMRLEVLRQLVDALGQERDLDLGRARVLAVELVRFDDGSFAFRSDQAEFLCAPS